jgi:hypothetical protein
MSGWIWMRTRVDCGLGTTRRWLPTLACLTILPTLTSAQVIRGTVTERDSRAPVIGALVSLDPEGTVGVSANAVRRVLSNERGEFAIVAPGPGRYRISIRRIGVRAWVEDLVLARQETRRMDVVLDRVGIALPVVAVRDTSLCITRERDANRVASLWEAARTSLAAMVVSDSDTVTGRRLVRFERKRLPYDMTITSETVHSYDERDGLREALFASLSGDSLSRAGFWRQTGSNAMSFFAPDAQALLSLAFLRDHCFSVGEGDRGERDGQVGLVFQPVRGRRRDIAGTLWLDARTFELQTLEFDWLDLPPVMRHERVGGELRFLRLPDGSVIVRRWSLRMPRPGAVMTARASIMDQRPIPADTLIEHGGLIVLYGLGDDGPPGQVTGEVRGPDGGPLRWAQVRLVGTAHVAVVDSAGRFAFDSVSPGAHAIVVQHARFDAFGLRVAEQEFVLDEGSARHLTFVAPSERQMGDALCPNRNFRWATLRITLLDRRTSSPVGDAALRLQWLTLVHEDRLGARQPVAVMRDVFRDASTTDRGVAVFCSIEPAKDLTLSLLAPGDRLTPLARFKLGPRENGNVVVHLPPQGR